jgi:hypothetical protein
MYLNTISRATVKVQIGFTTQFGCKRFIFKRFGCKRIQLIGMDLESKNCLFSVWNKGKKHSLPKTKKTKQI